MRVPSCSLLSWARMRCVCVVCVACCLSACVRGRACVCRRARCSAGPVCGVCVSCASVACRRACVSGHACAVVLAAQLGPYAVCVRRVRRLLPVGVRAWAGMRVPSCSLLSWARMRCVCVVCVACCLSACVRGRACVCRRARCSAGPVCGVCVSCASVACRRACVSGHACAVVLGAQLGPYAVCVCRVRRLLPVGVRAWAGVCVPSCSLLSWARMRCVCVVCVVCCLSACVRGRACVCRRAHCSAGPVCGVCVSCASPVACRRACVGGHACAVVLGAQLGPYAVCVCRVRLLPVGVRA